MKEQIKKLEELRNNLYKFTETPQDYLARLDEVIADLKVKEYEKKSLDFAKECLHREFPNTPAFFPVN